MAASSRTKAPGERGHPCNGAPLSPGAFVRLDAAALEEGGEGEDDHADRYCETQD